jgi:hypothetical protein
MSQLILGAIALAGVLWLLKSYTRTNPSLLARGGRTVAGLAVMAVGALLLVRGRFDMAVPLFVLGAGLAGWMPGWGGFPGLGGRARPKPGGRSRVVSRLIVMELDHDTGAMAGRVVAGQFAGRDLDALGPAELAALHRETAVDPDARSLLEAYLDRRAPGWREAFQQDPAARADEGRRRTNAMSEEEAYEILGVQPGADTETIRRAHRSLMKKLHPDQGGSTYLATRVNEARDRLLGRHH